MQDLQLIGVHEDGEHLLLSGANDAHFRLPVDEALRAAIRRDRPHLGGQQTEEGGLRPRDVQALIRAGATADEAASRAGWTVEKVHRYEGPILAEREHVAGLAQKARLRTRAGVSGGNSSPTLSARVTERLKSRDVEITGTSWDSWRAEEGPWIAVLTFAAGGRQRQASWSFDLADRTVSAVDDEARWLSEEVQSAEGPIPAPQRHVASGRDTMVYDVEAEGGLRPVAHDERQDDPLDLMTAMRKRSTARTRRKRAGQGASPKAVASVPKAASHTPEQVLPLDDPAHDHETTPPRTDEIAAVDTSPGDTSPNETSPERGEQTREPAEKSGQQGRSVARAKRPAHEPARKAGRPSVPAWDEIMFGSRPGADRSSS